MTRVLIVEDDNATRALIEKLLSLYDLDVTTVENGSQALEILAEVNGAFEVVVTDVMMPFIDGVTLTREIRQQYPAMSIVVTSAFTDKAQEAVRVGANCYLAKPFTGKQLLGLIEKMIPALT